MMNDEVDFDALISQGMLSEYRDMLDETKGMASEEAFLNSDIENPMDAVGGLSDLSATDEDNLGVMPMDGLDPSMSMGMGEDQSMYPDEDSMELEDSAGELEDAKGLAELSQAYQERIAGRNYNG